MVASIEGDGDLGPTEGLNRVPEHRVDVTVVLLDAMLAGRRTGASEDDVELLTTRSFS